MTMYFTEPSRTALLHWVNTFKTKRPVTSLEELTDGIKFGEILEILVGTGTFSASSLVREPVSRQDKKQNLEAVFRELSQVIRQDNPDLAPTPSQVRAIADNPTEAGMCEFVTALVAAACMGAQSQTHIPKVLSLGQSDQQEIATIIQRLQKKQEDATKNKSPEKTEADLSAWESTALEASRDQDLRQEERETQLRGEIEKLKKQNADLTTRLESLTMKHNDLNSILRQVENNYDTLQKTQSTGVPKVVRELEEERRANVALIDQLQEQLNELEEQSSKLRRENAGLQTKANRAKDLEDQVRDLQHEVQNREKTERVLENYKKKAQESTTYQQQIRDLQAKMELLQDAAAEAETLRMQVDQRDRHLKEFREHQEKSETTIHEQDVLRSNLQQSINDLRAQLEDGESRRQIYEATIKEYEERANEGLGITSGTGSPTREATGLNLEQELQTTGDPSAALRLEVSKLRAENNLLRNNMTVQAEAQRLRGELDLASRKNAHLTTQYSEAVEKNAVAQEQINALVGSVPADKLVHTLDGLLEKGPLRLLTPGYFRDKAFIDMRTKHLQTIEQLKRREEENQTLAARLGEKERELIAAQTDCTLLRYLAEIHDSVADEYDEYAVTAVGKGSIEALEVLKSSDQLVSNSLHSELETLRKQLEAKTFEEEQLRSQLMDALVSKDKLRSDLDKAADAAANGKPASPTPVPEEEMKPRKVDLEKNEKLKTALKQKIQVSNHPVTPPSSSPPSSPGAFAQETSPYLLAQLGLPSPPPAVTRIVDDGLSGPLSRVMPPPEALRAIHRQPQHEEKKWWSWFGRKSMSSSPVRPARDWARGPTVQTPWPRLSSESAGSSLHSLARPHILVDPIFPSS
jgi:protein HOOK3